MVTEEVGLDLSAVSRRAQAKVRMGCPQFPTQGVRGGVPRGVVAGVGRHVEELVEEDGFLDTGDRSIRPSPNATFATDSVTGLETPSAPVPRAHRGKLF